MKFGPISLEQAEGKILGHNIATVNGRPPLRKGRRLSPDDLTSLRDAGRKTVYVAELDDGDLDEDAAALRIAEAINGTGLKLTGPANGRVNFRSTAQGVFRVDVARLHRLNELQGITLATLPEHATVRLNQIVSTVKVIPFALPERLLARADEIAADGESLVWLEPLERRSVGLILSASPGVQSRIETQFAPLRERIEGLGSELARVDYVDSGEEIAEAELVDALERQRAAGVDLIILAGETAVMDQDDIAPRAVERAGGHVECVGAPVDPGNLLMLAYLNEIPVLGAPGCARSRKINIIDWVLPRLLVGERMTRADIISMGHGGLLEDVPERPMPRSRV